MGKNTNILANAMAILMVASNCKATPFATGFNGDEHLGEDIIMKGQPFHYRSGLNKVLAIMWEVTE